MYRRYKALQIPEGGGVRTPPGPPLDPRMQLHLTLHVQWCYNHNPTRLFKQCSLHKPHNYPSQFLFNSEVFINGTVYSENMFVLHTNYNVLHYKIAMFLYLTCIVSWRHYLASSQAKSHFKSGDTERGRTSTAWAKWLTVTSIIIGVILIGTITALSVTVFSAAHKATSEASAALDAVLGRFKIDWWITPHTEQWTTLTNFWFQ